MSDDNNKREKNKGKTKAGKIVKRVLLVLLVIGIIGGGVVLGSVISIVREAPEIDATNINATLAQTSSILDLDGNVIEKIQAPEFRTVVTIDEMPQHLQDAFIAIEDKRFDKHMGVDPLGIVAAVIDNVKTGSLRGASTITQQLARGLYLNNDVNLTRKITEAYLAIQMEQVLTKDQILEAYLNRSSFGQNAYGVQEAARTYFSKDVGELTIAESAIVAGIVKGPYIYQPYMRVRPEDFDSEAQYEVGRINVLGEPYILVYNERSVERQRIVLKEMLDLGKITQEQYEEALQQDIKTSLKPEQKKELDITSYFTDYVKTTVVEELMDKLGYDREEAEDLLFAGGLKIYSTIDVNMQRQLEDVYNNFTSILVGSTANVRAPVLVDWKLNSAGHVVDERNSIIFYKKETVLNSEYDLIVESGTYSLEDGDLVIKNGKMVPYGKHVDIADYYSIDNNKNLVTHTVGSVTIPEEHYTVNEDRSFRISKAFLDEHPDFHTIENNNLLINSKYFYMNKDGIVQPQSAAIILDYRTGHIKAVVGGRDVDGQRILNRATDSQRQPGSVIKPIATYLPALDNGYTAGSSIDDIPYFTNTGELWPKNWYSGYRGLYTLRKSIEQSVNVNTVKTLEDVGINTSKNYLTKLGIIDPENPEKDNFVSAAENPATNDENLAALGLGGMTKGLSPLEVTAAYGAIANNGVYVEPIAFTRIIDKNGNVLLENTPRETVVVSPQIAYIMGDILRTTVTNGLSSSARLSNMASAGKTGTTQHQADIWYSGYTPYYASSVWIGNDSPKITLARSSGTAAQLWRHINTKVHENLESKTSFQRPEGIVTANICTQSGLLATELCARDPRGVVKTEIFAAGTVPTQQCDMHVQLTIDKTNGKLANEYCPDENLETRVFVQRTPPYKPSDYRNIVPNDYNYNAPSQYCTDHDESTVRPDPIQEWLDQWLNNGGNNNGNEGNGNNGNNGNNSNNNDNGEVVIPLDPLD